jgi:NADH-quinone oxidoreductase chain G
MATDHMIGLTIDGQQVRCPAGCTVYEAATAAGIHIPTFCHHEKLVPVGACRMCLVEIAGARGLQTSCTTPVRDGMEVKVHTSPVAVKARKANIEFLLTNHPLDCPVCDKGGECPLQDQAMLDGPGQSRYIEAKRHKNKRYPLSELIVLDQERCVLCWRCIRFLDEWAGDHELDLFGRGADTRLDTFPGRPLSSKWQGNTIDICPVGALTSRGFRFEARVWELTDVPSICPLCSVGCNIVLGVKNNQLRRIVPRENMQVNDAWICDRGRFAHGFVDHPDRLKTPLIRRDDGLRPATWEEALDLIARRFNGILESNGPQAIAGLGSTRATNEANYLFQRFMRTIVGSNSVDHLGRMPSGASPLTSLPALEHKDVFLLLGFDPSTEAPLVELWIKKALLRHDARVLVASPRQIELGRYAGETSWLGYRPGTAVTLINGLARAILAAGLDESRAQRTRVTNLTEFRAWLGDYSPEQVERVTGVAAGTLRQAAEILAQARRPIILYGPNWVRERDVEAHLDTGANLALLLGGIEASFVANDGNTLGALEMGVVPDLYPGHQPLDDHKVRSRMASLWGSKLSPVPGVGFDDMMVAAREARLKAMWIMGADPAHDCRMASSALGHIPFLVVQDLFLTETASLASVVLPAASFAETDGSLTNLTGRWQAIRAAMRPPGQARPDWWIITQLARVMVDSKRQRAWDFAGTADVLSEMARVLPGCRGLDHTTMGEGGWQCPEQAEATRRAFVRVAPDPSGLSYSGPGRSPQHPDYPLILVTGWLLYDRGTLLRRSRRIEKLVPDSFVMIHPADAAELGLADGDDVSLVSAKGRLGFILRVSEEVVPGAVFAPLDLSDVPLSVLFENCWTSPRVKVVK